jgi:hypothetical protein
MGVKLTKGRSVNVDVPFDGRSVRAKMFSGRSVGGRSIKAPQERAQICLSSVLVLVLVPDKITREWGKFVSHTKQTKWGLGYWQRPKKALPTSRPRQHLGPKFGQLSTIKK